MSLSGEENSQQIDRTIHERILWEEGFERIMGLDEVGRGCLSGPVMAAGVIFAPGTWLPEVKDSKQLTLSEREELSGQIKEEAEFWTVQWCTAGEIDELNILKASIKAMNRCTRAKGADPDYLLVDGNRYSGSLHPHKCLVKGDDRSMSIAAASIIAKVYRDKWMIRQHEQYPHYGWDTNVGYPTQRHFEGLKKHGITKLHRKSFNLRTKKKLKKKS